jgi:hypothetical protein
VYNGTTVNTLDNGFLGYTFTNLVAEAHPEWMLKFQDKQWKYLLKDGMGVFFCSLFFGLVVLVLTIRRFAF